MLPPKGQKIVRIVRRERWESDVPMDREGAHFAISNVSKLPLVNMLSSPLRLRRA